MFFKLNNAKVASLVLVTSGVAIFALGIYRGFIHVPTGEVMLSIKESDTISIAKKNQGLPERVIIPKINLDTKVEEVGITFKGNMSTPKDIGNTGWYKYGTVPGDLGSAVIDGHVDNGFNLPGVFADLNKLERGDHVYIETQNKKILHFVVEKVSVFPYKEVPTEELFNKNDTSRLNLITCEGDWIPEDETDENRLIVYTRLVN